MKHLKKLLLEIVQVVIVIVSMPAILWAILAIWSIEQLEDEIKGKENRRKVGRFG